jgi:hypothetical protein
VTVLYRLPLTERGTGSADTAELLVGRGHQIGKVVVRLSVASGKLG